MRFVIRDTSKCERFVAIFQQLKSLAESLCWTMSDGGVRVQGMDPGHVAMFQLALDGTWLDQLVFGETGDPSFCVSSGLLARLLGMRADNQTIDFELDAAKDSVKIKLESSHKEEFNKSFVLPLLDNEQDALDVPEMEYSAEFSMGSKKLGVLVDQLALMSDAVDICCDGETVKFTAEGLEGKMEVVIPEDDVEEYVIEEDTTVDVRFGLNYMKKLCQYHKVSDTVELQISGEFPLLVAYRLNASNFLKFYLAPKIGDGE